MQTKLRIVSLFSLLLWLSATMSSCKKDQDVDRVVTMKVAPKLIQVAPRPPASPDNPAIIYNMNITEVETNKTYSMNLGQIEGFTYDAGYDYVLKVLKAQIKDPPQDGSSVKYTLVKVVSKTKSL